MKYPRSIFDFYLDASVHVAVAVLCLMHVTAFYISMPQFNHLSYYVFFGTIGTYNFIKYGVEAEKYLVVASRYHRIIQFFSFICLALAMYHAFFLAWATWMAIAILILFTGLYSLPVFPHGKRLRSLGLLKIIMVALIWAGTTVILPVINGRVPFSRDIGTESMQRFILIIILMIPFEVRDLTYDSPALRTLPQRLGVRNTKIIGIIASVLFLGLTFVKTRVGLPEIGSKAVLFVILLGMLVRMRKEQSRYFASFWVEAIPVFWWLAAWLLDRYNQI